MPHTNRCKLLRISIRYWSIRLLKQLNIYIQLCIYTFFLIKWCCLGPIPYNYIYKFSFWGGRHIILPPYHIRDIFMRTKTTRVRVKVDLDIVKSKREEKTICGYHISHCFTSNPTVDVTAALSRLNQWNSSDSGVWETPKR